MKIRKLLALVSSLMAIAILCTATFSSPVIKALDDPASEVKVTYYGNGGITAEGLESVEAVGTVLAENTFVKDTHKFIAWNTMQDGTGTTYFPGDAIHAGYTELSVYAMWEADWYNLYYDGNGGQTAEGLTVVDGGQQKLNSRVTFGENTFVREGYDFVCWNTKADGSGQKGMTGQRFLMPARDMTFYAVWQATSDVDESDTETDVNTDVVSDTEGEVSDTDVVSDTEADDTDTTTATDSEVSTDTSTDTTTDTATDSESDTEVAPAVKHKVTYVVAEDETVDGGSYAEGDSITVIEFTGKAPKGQFFSHWSLDKKGETKKYVAGDKIVMGDADLTLYAIYKNNFYKVIYISNFGEENEEVIDGPFEYSSVVTAEKSTFERPGYTFAGWNTLADGTGTNIKAGNKFYMPSFDARLYAKWVKNEVLDNNSSKDDTYGGNIKTGTDNTLVYISAALFSLSAILMLSCAFRKKKREF